MNSILERLRERLAEAKVDAEDSHKIDMNSVGAGYDVGYAQAIQDTITELTGDDWTVAIAN
jgi:hypothetical protein